MCLLHAFMDHQHGYMYYYLVSMSTNDVNMLIQGYAVCSLAGLDAELEIAPDEVR